MMIAVNQCKYLTLAEGGLVVGLIEGETEGLFVGNSVGLAIGLSSVGCVNKRSVS